MPSSTEYLHYIAPGSGLRRRAGRVGNPVSVVHAETGDGGLPDTERATLEAARSVTLVTIPGSVLLPDEAPQETAAAIAAALSQVS